MNPPEPGPSIMSLNVTDEFAAMSDLSAAAPTWCSRIREPAVDRLVRTLGGVGDL